MKLLFSIFPNKNEYKEFNAIKKRLNKIRPISMKILLRTFRYEKIELITTENERRQAIKDIQTETDMAIF